MRALVSPRGHDMEGGSQLELFGKPDPLPGADLEGLPIVSVPLDSLVVADSPRRSGPSAQHVRRLAESQSGLPPILVHRQTMRIIDGTHRFRVAQLRGQQEIDVRFTDCDEASSFVLGVRANITHGLPLTLSDRKAAAARVISLYPQWSDRMVASVTGLAAKTVAAVRKRLTGDFQQPDKRVGMDGRARPVDGAQRRQIAAKLLAENPHASLREIAIQAGVSPETVRTLRTRQNRGELDSVRQARGVSAVNGSVVNGSAVGGSAAAGKTEPARALRALRADPALRSTESGRTLLRMLAAFMTIEDCGQQILQEAPVHCLSRVAEASLACARSWQGFAEQTERQRRALSGTAS
jgi:ParB-like chromosome segregation protein Spo0J